LLFIFLDQNLSLAIELVSTFFTLGFSVLLL